ncbi:MAG: hypothetical protein M1837_001456 [Sclerophora amabilis]|nr:MAG: hypothetical protein M1837_001456 [Sclerophora amabilis]
MDPLSVTASIATLIHLTVKLGSVCQQYYFGVKEARKDIQRVIDEMASLSDVLQTLKGIVDSSSGASLAISHSLNGPDGPLQQCYSEMRMIGEKLDASDGKWRSMKKSFAWPFKEKDVTKIVTVIERQKSTLELGLTVDNTAMAIATKDGLQELRDAIIEANLDSKRQRILNWLAGTDPSKNHNAAREKHEPTTGDWLTRGSTLEGWRTAPNSLLWLHGKVVSPDVHYTGLLA